MFVHRFPHFGKGRILKKEMLENLRDFPRELAGIYFTDYANGILAGCQLIIQEKTIHITKGVINFQQNLYFLREDYLLDYHQTNRELVLKVRFLPATHENDHTLSPTEIWLDQELVLKENELELGRFKLREGAKLRSDYQDFYDFNTEYNTINLIQTAYAAPDSSTLHPLILKYFSRSLLKSGSPNPWDLNFAMYCLGATLINRELILTYLAHRLEREYQDYPNLTIFKHLTTILRSVASGVKQKPGPANKKPLQIIVD